MTACSFSSAHARQRNTMFQRILATHHLTGHGRSRPQIKHCPRGGGRAWRLHWRGTSTARGSSVSACGRDVSAEREAARRALDGQAACRSTLQRVTGVEASRLRRADGRPNLAKRDLAWPIPGAGGEARALRSRQPAPRSSQNGQSRRCDSLIAVAPGLLAQCCQTVERRRRTPGHNLGESRARQSPLMRSYRAASG